MASFDNKSFRDEQAVIHGVENWVMKKAYESAFADFDSIVLPKIYLPLHICNRDRSLWEYSITSILLEESGTDKRMIFAKKAYDD